MIGTLMQIDLWTLLAGAGASVALMVTPGPGMAFLSQFADPAIGPVWHPLLAFGLAVSLIGLIFDCLYGGFAGILAQRIRRASRLKNRISAIVFGGLAARLAIN